MTKVLRTAKRGGFVQHFCYDTQFRWSIRRCRTVSPASRLTFPADADSGIVRTHLVILLASRGGVCTLMKTLAGGAVLAMLIVRRLSREDGFRQETFVDSEAEFEPYSMAMAECGWGGHNP